ncbi:MAG TPA: hypothetical protein VF266_16950 [Thermoanaerobaculia bacterium]
MATRTLMYWNVENIGLGKRGKYTVTAAELVDIIAKVVLDTNVDVIAMNEIRSNLGRQLGDDIVAALDSKHGAGQWARQASPQFTKGRLEQYLFIWRTSRLTANGFAWQFPNPMPPPANLGFPNQVTSDRPPYAADFTITPGGHRFIMAAFHAPGPGYFNGVKRGCNNLALVTAFQPPAPSNVAVVIMGDCNVKNPIDVSQVGSFGWQAFLPLVNINYSQTFISLTSLKSVKDADPSWTIEDAYSEPYDQIFFRRSAAITASGASREELLVEAKAGRYLNLPLRKIQGKRTGQQPAQFADVSEIFLAYRKYVSDHAPVIVDLDY